MTARSSRIVLMTAAFLAGLVLCFGVVLIVTGRLSAPVAQQIAAIGGPFKLWEFRGQAPNVTLTVVGDLRSSNGEAMSAIFRNHRDEGPISGSREIKDRRKRLNAIFDATSDAG